ncbi:MAG TPA: CBS domain-containing protein, partial [Anaerolineaceae bacterium]|nr:CBS domain-containing protein [Anaerolineaceae bacterium]
TEVRAMTTVKHLLKAKGRQVWSVPPTATLGEALKLMSEKRIGALLIAMDEKYIQGIFSERDLARMVAETGCVDMQRPVRELMTEVVYFVTQDHTIEDCMALMTQQRIRHLPVVEKGEVKGMISIGDVVKLLIEDKDVTIRSLENFILGRELST